MESKPVKTINIHDHLRSKLCDLYENDCIFDKFECIFGGDGKCVAQTQRIVAELMRIQASLDRVLPQLLPNL